MTARRQSEGGEIDRARRLSFTFDGRTIEGYAGDTIASALLAGGVRIVGRSFKYHRPRGIWGFGVEEPNAFIDVTRVPKPRPNVQATTEAACDGAAIKSVNAFPSAERDRHAFIDRFARFIPAGFYYKTFMFPGWHAFEPRIRAMAGLGELDSGWASTAHADQINHHCDVLVVGAGPAGLAAALASAEAGKKVVLCEQDRRLGGSLLHRGGEIDGEPGNVWVEKAGARLRALGATVLPNTTAFGLYDHDLVALNQRRAERPDTLWRVRPRRIVLATGAVERPLAFGNNDLPGVMSADAALAYLRRHAVVAGTRIAVLTNNDTGYEPAVALAEAGAHVTVVDCRPEAQIGAGHRQTKIAVRHGRHVTDATGRSVVDGVLLDDGTHLDADSVLAAGGWTPTVHLYCQARGRLAWSESLSAFVPRDDLPGVAVAGAARGTIGLANALASGAKAASATGSESRAPISTGSDLGLSISPSPAWPIPKRKERVWIDYQNDVTAKDIELAARENYVSVEHLKRYTTLGMAIDQGKTSNLNGLALMADITGRSIPDVGTTTYRPPFTPVPFTSFAGANTGTVMSPLRRSPIEACHRADGALLLEYGGWLRPACYGAGPANERIQQEARQAREGVALFDGSTLGKIEVIGPQAAAFLDFIYYNTMSTLKPGRCRYGFILTEAGIVYDDGVLVRVDDNRFIVSCSSSHVAGVYALLEQWRQDCFDPSQLFIHDATAQMATLTVSGPNARRLLENVGLGVALDDTALPHMATASGTFQGAPVRITRVSFTGDRSYEVSIRSDRAETLWTRMKAAGESLHATLIGLEALMILRAEKGYIVIGKDTDGTTRPHDIGAASLSRKKTDFVGRRSLLTEDAVRDDRRELVGLTVAEGEEQLPTGAHGIVRSAGKTRSIGYVTSSYTSPTLARPIALAMIERGRGRIGETIEVLHLGAVRSATIAPACAYDPEGARLNA